jgi:hypothetical protein
LLQPTVERPEALKFEDDGGILPVHSVGLEMGGGSRGESWELHYVANLANGRGLDREAVQGGADLNRDKALGVKLTLVVEGPGRLEIGPGGVLSRSHSGQSRDPGARAPDVRTDPGLSRPLAEWSHGARRVLPGAPRGPRHRSEMESRCLVRDRTAT